MRTSFPQTGIAIAALLGLFVNCTTSIKGNGEYGVDSGSKQSIVADASPGLAIDAGYDAALVFDAAPLPDARPTCIEGDFQVEDGGTCYMLFHQLRTWPQAQQECVSLGGNLVVVDSAEEQVIVGALAGNYSGNPDTFMGGTDADTEGTWTWVTGAAFVYTHWRGGEPNNGNGNEDCTIIEGDNGNREWDDRPCTTAFPYMCER